MLNDGKPKLYWDACVALSYINEIADRMPDIEGLLQRGGKDFHIITSILSITEVAFAATEQNGKALDPAQEERIKKLWRYGSPIELVELYQTIAEFARDLMREGITKGWQLKPADAVHLATAAHFGVEQFHTYDQTLHKYSGLNEKMKFPIGPPQAATPVMYYPSPQEPPVAEATEKPVEKADTGAAVEENKREADTTHPAPVRGSDGGRAQSETTGKADKSEPEKTKPAKEGGVGGGSA